VLFPRKNSRAEMNFYDFSHKSLSKKLLLVIVSKDRLSLQPAWPSRRAEISESTGWC
jgi:hypothetical protein